MNKYKVELTVKANDREQLAEKLQAFQDLQDNLEHEDLLDARDIIIDNPDLVEFIREVVPKEGEDLSLGDYLSIARKAWVKFG